MEFPVNMHGPNRPLLLSETQSEYHQSLNTVFLEMPKSRSESKRSSTCCWDVAQMGPPDLCHQSGLRQCNGIAWTSRQYLDPAPAAMKRFQVAASFVYAHHPHEQLWERYVSTLRVFKHLMFWMFDLVSPPKREQQLLNVIMWFWAATK